MKKKFGFTLVELLAVIIILGILAVVTVPLILNTIDNSRIKTIKSSAHGLIESANLYYARYGAGDDVRFEIKDGKMTSKDTDNLLSYKGGIKEGTVIIDKYGKVTVCITDGKNSAYKNKTEEEVTTVKGQKCYIKDDENVVDFR